MPLTETRETLVRQVDAFVRDRFGGDFKKAFDAADTNGDGKLTRSEIAGFLAQAGCGCSLTRWAIALQIIETMDVNNDNAVSWDEFQKLTHVS